MMLGSACTVVKPTHSSQLQRVVALVELNPIISIRMYCDSTTDVHRVRRDHAPLGASSRSSLRLGSRPTQLVELH